MDENSNIKKLTNSPTVYYDYPLKPTCTIVIPVYNSEKSLPVLVEKLNLILPAISSNYELILVNDGSQDNSWEVISQLSQQYDWISAINLFRNFGQHNALLCGIRLAKYDIIVTMDDDLQNPPEEIYKLIKCLVDEKADVVYGIPMREQHGIWRDLASQITKLSFQSAMGIENARNVSAFRAFRTQLRDAFVTYRGPYVSIDVLLTWSTTRFLSVRVHHDQRKIGRSNYSFGKLITHAINMMTGFGVLPLQIASILGFLFVLFGILVFIYVVGRYMIQGSPVAGFPFLASIIALFSGVQLFALGIIGEYLARMYFRMMDKPSYAIRSTILSQRSSDES